MKEIERKWIVSLTDEVREILMQGGIEIKDYYFNQYTRLRNYNGEWFITIKGEGTLIRDEYEFKIDKSQINFLPTPQLIKKRVPFEYKNQKFELNVFRDIPALNKKTDKCHNLILAEIELSSSDEKVEIPEFFSIEVTNDKRFYGYNLLKSLEKYQQSHYGDIKF